MDRHSAGNERAPGGRPEAQRQVETASSIPHDSAPLQAGDCGPIKIIGGLDETDGSPVIALSVRGALVAMDLRQALDLAANILTTAKLLLESRGGADADV